MKVIRSYKNIVVIIIGCSKTGQKALKMGENSAFDAKNSIYPWPYESKYSFQQNNLKWNF